jgi:acetyl-CoA carboxylase biotin carboxyl carrier protein
MERGTTTVSNSRDAIRRVVEAFERSDWSEIDVRSGDVRIHLSVSAGKGSPDTTSGQPPPAAATPDEHTDNAGPRSEGGSVTASVAASDAPPTGAHVVVSPSPGIFWRSPEPGRPPFVELGHTVEKSATVCIVEVMKLMNHVKAGIRGEVVGVYCENGAAVRKDQALFAIVPSETPR